VPDAQYDVKVTVGDAEIEVHGAKEGVVEIVKALSEVLAGRAQPRQPEASRTADTAAEVVPARVSQIDARSFFQEKQPSSQTEAITVGIYYLTELAPPEMRIPAADAKSLTQVFRQARWPLPKRMPQSLVNTLNAGYLVRVGAGEYKLSPVGFNLVEHTLGPNA
jgi:hypothetical protein